LWTRARNSGSTFACPRAIRVTVALLTWARLASSLNDVFFFIFRQIYQYIEKRVFRK
jgi:hypothetical protein